LILYARLSKQKSVSTVVYDINNVRFNKYPKCKKTETQYSESWDRRWHTRCHSAKSSIVIAHNTKTPVDRGKRFTPDHSCHWLNLTL